MFKEKKFVEKGIIKYTNGNRATVEVIKQDMQQDCKSCMSCVDAGNKPEFIEIDAFPGLNAGQRVTLQTIKHSPYKGMLLIFVLPVLNLVIGSFLGQKICVSYQKSQEVSILCCGFLFFLLTIVAVSIYEKMTKNKKSIHRKILSPDTQNTEDLFPG
ncbi:SoxR reducing system RseC family protein [Candidatus Brocadia pituitae]|nr:SoxR reducing system RseC family protein [Candidatus Brocadia pituitae]